MSRGGVAGERAETAAVEVQVEQGRAVAVTVSCAVRRRRYLSGTGIGRYPISNSSACNLAEVLCAAQKAGFDR